MAEIEIEALKLYDISELTKIFGVDRHVIYKYRESGLLKARKIGKSWRSSGDEIREFYRVTAGKDISNEMKMNIVASQNRKLEETSHKRKNPATR